MMEKTQCRFLNVSAEWCRARGVILAAAVVMAALGCLSCQRDTGRIRVEHKLHSEKKGTVYDSGEMAGRVIFAVGAEGVPAGGASVLVVDTAAGKQVLEQLQKEPEAACVKRLGDMETLLLNAAKASAQAGQTPPTATADPDGYFVLPQVRPGAYLVIAYGRAGDVQAIWEQPALVERYRAVMVKMVDPLISCAAVEEKPSQPPPLPPPNLKPIQPSAPPKPSPQPAVPPPGQPPVPQS